MSDLLSQTLAAIAVHKTGTSDAAWDAGANEKNLDNDDGAEEYRKAYAWVDPDADPDTKAAYSFCHHFVSSDGTVGDASTKACSSTMAVLNGGRGVDVKNQPWFDSRKGIAAHVLAHLKDSGVADDDLPELDDMAVVDARLAAARQRELDEMRQALDGEPLAAVHPAFSGRHTHAHSCFQRQASTGEESVETSHTHSHSHNGDSRHDHSHGAATVGPGRFAGMGEAERRRHDGANEITDPDALAALVASALARRGVEAVTAATKPDGTVVGAAWHAYLCPEGVRTDDMRELLPGCCQFPDLPVSMRLLVEDEGGHWGAVTCGRIDTMARNTDLTPTMIYATGVFGSDPNGQLAELMVAEQTQRFISIDPRNVEGEWITVTIATGDGDWDDDVFLDEWLRISSCVIGAATIVPIPAYPQAVITLANVDLPDAPIANATAPPSLPNPALLAGLTASSAPLRPPREWFADPGFTEGDPRLVLQADGRSYACPWTITKEGQAYGHVAWWECAHTGYTGRVVKPPRSRSGYAYYLTGGGVECDDGSIIEGIGQVSAGCGHAGTSLDWKAAQAFYDGGYGAWTVADLRAGEDAFGPWVAGALRPGLTDEKIREARALSLSGDWREIGGHLELVAVLAVPVPGFPIRRALAASGAAEIDLYGVREGIRDERIISLVAAGRVDPIPLEVRTERLEREMLRMQESLHALAVRYERASLTGEM